jgi:hypothetical protein
MRRPIGKYRPAEREANTAGVVRWLLTAFAPQTRRIALS